MDHQIAELAARQQVSVERIVAAALAEQLSGWTRVEQMAELGSRERFLTALDKVPAAEPAPEDKIQAASIFTRSAPNAWLSFQTAADRPSRLRSPRSAAPRPSARPIATSSPAPLRRHTPAPAR